MPEGPFTKVYNIVTAFAVLYVGFTVFVMLGFANFLPPRGLHTFEKVIDAWFWFDMALNFITAFYHNGKIVTHPLEIMAHYGKSWFIVDLLGNIPYEAILDLNSTPRTGRELVKVVKFLKIPRLLRLARLRRILQGKGKYISLIVYFALVLLGIHAAGCLWMLVLAPCGHFPPECDLDGTICDWKYYEDIIPSIVLSSPYLGPECLPSKIGSLYAMAFSYGASMVLGSSGLDPTTMDGGHYRTRESTLGDNFNNDTFSFFETTVSTNSQTTLTIHDLINVSPFPPNSFGDSSWTSMWILSAIIRILGYVVVAFLTGVIVKLEINAGYRETMFRRRVDAIEAELHSYGALIPESLMRRIREHIAERWHTGDFGSSELMTSGIFSDQLRGEIVASLNKDVLMKIPFFRSATFEAIQQVCAVAQERKFLAGELIYRRGEISSGLYLVRSGTVIVTPLSYSSWGGSIRRRWNPEGEGEADGVANQEEIRDEGTRPMKVSFMRMKRKAKASLRKSFSRRSFLNRSSRSKNSTVFPLSTTAFPVTAGSWFGESELVREICMESDASDCRRTTTVEAKTNVRLLFISKNDLSKILFENPQILMELLICHEKRFNSPDIPEDLREAFRFSDEWEERLAKVVAEISRARQVNIFQSSTSFS